MLSSVTLHKDSFKTEIIFQIFMELTYNTVHLLQLQYPFFQVCRIDETTTFDACYMCVWAKDLFLLWFNSCICQVQSIIEVLQSSNSRCLIQSMRSKGHSVHWDVGLENVRRFEGIQRVIWDGETLVYFPQKIGKDVWLLRSSDLYFLLNQILRS